MEHTRNQPILLIGAGPAGVATLRQLPRVARSLSVRVAGPFGLIAGRGGGSRVRTSNSFWLSEIDVPDATRDGAILTGELDETLFEDVCSLLRHLQAGGQEAAAGGGSRVRIHAYVVVDLSVPGIVPFVVQLIQLVRRADPAIEMTGLTLTGRTAGTGTSPASIWHESFEQLVGSLEQAHLLQRLYILDGEDTNRTWLRNVEEMHRIGAEFILHHGLSPYRHHLRRREKTRTSLGEGFLGFCGSLMCKRFSWDAAAVAREIAATVASDPALQEKDQGVLSQERSAVLDGLAQRLVTEVSAAYESDGPPEVTPSAGGDRDDRVRASLDQTLKEVCSEEPVLSLRWFLGRFRLRLDELTTVSRLRARWDSRHRVARMLRKQVKDTYAPIKRWQEQRDVQWQTPFRPFFKEAPSAILSEPVSMEYYLLAMGIATVGLGLVAFGGWTGRPVPMIAGGIVAIWAPLVTALAARWVRRPRTVILDDGGDPEAVPDTFYRTGFSPAQLALSTVFLVGTLGSLGWTLWARHAGTIGATAVLFVGLAAVLGLIGAVLVYLGSTRVHWPHGVPDEREIPDLAPPRSRFWSVAGLACFTLAWGALCRSVGSLDVVFSPPVLRVGLASAWAALGVALFPRYKSVKLACTNLRKPALPAPLEARSIEVPRLANQVETLQSWVARLLGASDPPGAGALDWNHANLDDLLPRMFSPHWKDQLARIFRKELEAETGKPLEQMIDDPDHWARCLLAGLSDPDLESGNPLHFFCLYHVKRWLQGKPLERVIAQLTVDRGTLIAAVSGSVPPRWPQTRDDPEIDAGVIAVGKELWDLIAPFMEPDDPHRFVMVDWQDPYTVAAVRTVQGLSRGWHGFPSLTGLSEPAGEVEPVVRLVELDERRGTSRRVDRVPSP